MIRIAITGPESSGKTTLAQELSTLFKGELIPEFAREYLHDKGLNYDQDDLDEIARGQLKIINNSQNSIQFIDTEFSVLKIWSEYRFGKTSQLIDDLLKEVRFDKHLLCAPDIPWEPDPLRENPDDRQLLFQQYETLLKEMQLPYLVIGGSREDRLTTCINFLREEFKIFP